MECIFLNAADTTLFVRDDMESGHWVQEQMNLTACFPYDSAKIIESGQRIAFRDPATDAIQVFEIINVENHEPDHYQQITAEHICIAELSDEHINSAEISNKTAKQALTTALTGTLWSAGTSTASGSQSADFSRGSVWNAIGTIQQNWNVYITPRVTISSAGAITGRYLDIAPAEGVSRGLRLSVRKNMVDPCVTYDESEVYTALFGYGGSVDVAQQSGDDKTEELTFKDVVWTATSSHPAKPSGQTYLEWPAKTAIYGRNGRPRYGYYQNASIKNATTLLEKTWETLQQSCEPKISISGTVVDLYRLGYTDQPLRLHDQVIVEIEETGELFYKQIVCCDIDLIDPTGSRVEIGDYIPNIVYINRDTNKKTTGSGGGGGHGMDNPKDEEIKWYTEFIKTQSQIGMVVRRKDGTDYIDAAAICISINQSGETAAMIHADKIYLLGETIANTITAEYINAKIATIPTLTGISASFSGNVTATGGVTGSGIYYTGNGATQSLHNAIKLVQIVGPVNNEYTLQYQTFSSNGWQNAAVSFSRATSLSGSWSGGIFTVTASPQDEHYYQAITSGAWENFDGSAYTSGNIFYIPILAYTPFVDPPAYVTVNRVYVDATSIYTSGYNTGSPDGHITIGSLITGTEYNITIRRADHTTVASTKDFASIYKRGWNECIDAATPVTRYTRSTVGGGGAYGGSNYTHYILYQGSYKDVGTGWYTTSQADAYTLPAKK